MSWKKQKTRNHLIRCFRYTNVHKISYKIEKLTILSVQKNFNSLKTLIKISTLLELITTQRSFFIRSKKSFAALKLRKGTPIGAKVTLRKSKMFGFLVKLLWQVLPNIKNFFYKKKNYKLKQNNINSLRLTIPSALNFLELQSFYFFFKTFSNLKITFSFSKKISTQELFFTGRFYKISV